MCGFRKVTGETGPSENRDSSVHKKKQKKNSEIIFAQGIVKRDFSLCLLFVLCGRMRMNGNKITRDWINGFFYQCLMKMCVQLNLYRSKALCLSSVTPKKKNRPQTKRYIYILYVLYVLYVFKEPKNPKKHYQHLVFLQKKNCPQWGTNCISAGAFHFNLKHKCF